MWSTNAITENLRFNRLNPQLDLYHKILRGSKLETGRILTSCPFAANWLTSQIWMRLHMQNFLLPSGVLFHVESDVESTSWVITAPASYTLLASGRNPRWRRRGCIYNMLVNKRKTRSNPIFWDKGPDVKVGKVWELNRNCSDRSHLLCGIVESLQSQVFRRSIASFCLGSSLVKFMFAANFRVVHLG